jgi:cell division protein FtsQ
VTKRAVRRTSTRRPAQAKRAPARRKARPGLLDQAVAALGVSEKTIQRIATWGIVGLAGIGALGVASWFGLPAMAGVAISEAVGEAGLKLEKIEITGLKRMDQMTVYAQALDQKSRAMPLVDLAGVRERLLKYPWIEDARISRRLPNTLAIHIIEREPAAVWQNRGQLMLIDAKGEPLAPVSRDAMPDLPLLIGDNANGQEEARRRLMEAAPELQQVVRAASWIGNRRWDLVFDTGERLQLPEGEAAAVAALSEFAQRDARERLLGGRWQRFDMRDPRNFILCCRRKPDPVPAQPAEQSNEAAPAAAPKSDEGQE